VCVTDEGEAKRLCDICVPPGGFLRACMLCAVRPERKNRNIDKEEEA